jgi:F0F1-type ATP synthase assembly protein I
VLPNRPSPKGRLDPKDLKELTEHLGLVTHVGLTMVAAVGIGFALGYYLDRWSGTRGIWKAVCIPLGALSGFWAVYKTIDATDRRTRDRRR